MSATEDHAQPKNGPVQRLRGWLDRVPVIGNLNPPGPGGMKHAGSLVDVFASFVSLDNRVDRAEAEVALDLLRHAFPEADHGWLARRLHRALASPKAPAEVAETLREEFSRGERVSLGLQL
ncbi:MAG: hypothetical protein KJO79_10730, partial [Verrucomicrobiae bacterium]|nr:hypothetical protein [Verrucomicrobiae bacterium]NNJ87649.1 hypothetical protein [Akkermansiaceae bacterium]